MSHGPQLHETRIGQRFFEHTLPELVRELSRIADALETLAATTGPKPTPQPPEDDPR